MLMRKWETQDNYLGRDMSEYYVLYSKSRDSNIMQRHNFDAILEAIGGEKEGSVEVHCFGHWAWGYVEAIMIHESDAEAVAKGEAIREDLASCPIYGDEHNYWEMLYVEAREYWKGAGLSKRIEICAMSGVSIFAARRDVPDSELMDCLEEGL